MSKTRRFLVYAGMLSICFLAGAGTYMSPAIDAFQKAFPDTPQSTIMMCSTLPSLVSMIVMMIIGSMVGKKIGYKTVSVLGCALVVIGGVAPFFINSSWPVIVGLRLILGAGAGMFGVRNALIVKVVDGEKQAKFLGYANVAMTIGNIVMVQAAGILTEVSWRHAFLVNLFALIPMLLCLFFLEEPAPDAVAEADADKGAQLEKEKLGWRPVVYAVIQFIAVCTGYPVLTGLSIFMAQHSFGGAALAGTAISAFNLAGVLIGLVISQIMDKLKNFSFPFFAALIGLGIAVLVFFPSVATVFLGLILFGFGFYALCSILQIYNAEAAPASRVAFGSTLILAFNQLAVFASSYYIDICGKILPNTGSSIVSAYIVGVIVWVVLTVVTIFFKIVPASRKG